MFITFEGIDLSGKSTQANLLYKYFKKKKIKTILVREPGGTFISEKIRDILLDKKNTRMRYMTEFLLFSASRHQLTEEVIRPHLKKNYIVICDRYYDSSTAYQGYGGNLDIKTLEKINGIATGNLIPDITFYIDISYKDSIKRRKKINKSHDRIESKKTTYYDRVHKGYIIIAKKNPERVIVLDGKSSSYLIFSQIQKALSQKIPFNKIK